MYNSTIFYFRETRKIEMLAASHCNEIISGIIGQYHRGMNSNNETMTVNKAGSNSARYTSYSEVSKQ